MAPDGALLQSGERVDRPCARFGEGVGPRAVQVSLGALVVRGAAVPLAAGLVDADGDAAPVGITVRAAHEV